MRDLSGQTAFITGASHGLGLAIGHELARAGASVACVARPGSELDAAVEELSKLGAAIAAPADVTRGAELERAARTALERFGRIDIAVINAGTWNGALLQETTEEMWDALLNLNLKGAFLTLKAVLPAMIRARHGTIVGIASLIGWLCAAPDHVSVGNVTIWPLAAGVTGG